VADLHVLEDLRQGQDGGPGDERRGATGEDQQSASAGLEQPLRADDAVDVGRVGFAEVVADLVAEPVELLRDGGEVLVGELLEGRGGRAGRGCEGDGDGDGRAPDCGDVRPSEVPALLLPRSSDA
jgi:hypothetical protein